jgi:hypothetical protein
MKENEKFWWQIYHDFHCMTHDNPQLNLNRIIARNKKDFHKPVSHIFNLQRTVLVNLVPSFW